MNLTEFSGGYPQTPALLPGCSLWLEKRENEPFPEFDWKSCKTIDFSPALAGRAGILFLGLIISNSIIRSKVIVWRYRIEGEKIFRYHVRQAFFPQVNPELEIFPMVWQGSLVDPCCLGMVYWKTLNLYRKSQFIGNVKATPYIVAIVGQHFQ